MFRLAQKEHLIIPAHVDYLASLRDFITQIGDKYNFSHKFINTFKIAVDEAATNIIKHAYNDSEGYITVQAIIKSKCLTINILDQGAYFDPKWVQAPDIKASLEDSERIGLGIFMMRKLMDKIDYKKTDSGNELSLIKFDKYRRRFFRLDNLADLPTSLKVKYLVHALIFVTILNIAGFIYFYRDIESTVTAEFITFGQKTSNQIAKQICAIKPNLLEGSDGVSYLKAIIQPVYDENIGKIYSVSVEDSHGDIAWSTIPTEFAALFQRPQKADSASPGVYAYAIDAENDVYEFESTLTFGTENTSYRNLHILISKNYIQNQIQQKRFEKIKFGFISLGLSYILTAFLGYFIAYPIRKLTRWVRAAGHGEFYEDMDIDATSEIGEIAQAFTDITEKFNESQKHLADREKYEKEINLAQDIQKALLPREIPKIESLEIAAFYEAAKVVSGDFYDFIEVDQDNVGIAIADVSGKGVPGSLMMTIIRTALRTEARGATDAAEVLKKLNDFVQHEMKNGMFATIFYMVFNIKSATVNFASAGHMPLILHRKKSKKTYCINPNGFPVGIKLPDKDYFANNIKSETIQLLVDDLIILYTDGVTEAMNPQKDMYGEERLLNIIHKHHNLSLQKFNEKLKNTIYSFKEDRQLHDDITFVTIRQKPVPEQDNHNAQTADDSLSLDMKFISVEDVNKILEIICNNPEYDVTEISNELNTKKYGQIDVAPEKIKTELFRRQLHTVKLREKYIILKKGIKEDKAASPKHKLTLSGHIKKHESEPDKNSSAWNASAVRDYKAEIEPYNYSGPLVPDMEADLVFGNFIDELIASTHENKLPDKHPENESKNQITEIPAAETAVETPPKEIEQKLPGLEDISDLLVDSIFDKYLTNQFTAEDTVIDAAKVETGQKEIATDKPRIEFASKDLEYEFVLGFSDKIFDFEINESELDKYADIEAKYEIQKEQEREEYQLVFNIQHDIRPVDFKIEKEETATDGNLTGSPQKKSSINEDSIIVNKSKFTEEDHDSITEDIIMEPGETVSMAEAGADSFNIELEELENKILTTDARKDVDEISSEFEPEIRTEDIPEPEKSSEDEETDTSVVPPPHFEIEEESETETIVDFTPKKDFEIQSEEYLEFIVEEEESTQPETALPQLPAFEALKLDEFEDVYKVRYIDLKFSIRKYQDNETNGKQTVKKPDDVKSETDAQTIIADTPGKNTIETTEPNTEDIELLVGDDFLGLTELPDLQEDFAESDKTKTQEIEALETPVEKDATGGDKVSRDESILTEDIKKATVDSKSTESDDSLLSEIYQSALLAKQKDEGQVSNASFKDGEQTPPGSEESYYESSLDALLTDASGSDESDDTFIEEIASELARQDVRPAEFDIREKTSKLINLTCNELEDKYAKTKYSEINNIPEPVEVEYIPEKPETIPNKKLSPAKPVEFAVAEDLESKTEQTKADAAGTTDVKQPPPVESLQIEKTEPGTDSESTKVELNQYLMAGVKHYKNKEYEDAIIYLKKVVKIDPELKDAYAMLGNAYYRNGMLYEAIVAYEQLNPDSLQDASLHENLGLIYWKLNKKEKAIKSWQRVLSLHPERTDIQKRIDHILNSKNKIPDQSLNTSKDERQSTSQKTSVEQDKYRLLREGIEHYRNHKYESAITLFKSAIKLFPNKVEAYNYLGNAYFRNKMFAEAAQIYERLKNMDSSNTNMLENLGLIHLKQGAYDRAVEEWQKILSKHPERLDLKRKIEKVSQLI